MGNGVELILQQSKRPLFSTPHLSSLLSEDGRHCERGVGIKYRVFFRLMDSVGSFQKKKLNLPDG